MKLEKKAGGFSFYRVNDKLNPILADGNFPIQLIILQVGIQNHQEKIKIPIGSSKHGKIPGFGSEEIWIVYKHDIYLWSSL
jgi:hypothetical protein